MCQFSFHTVQTLTPVQEAKALMEIFPDVWLDVWMLASYLEAEAEGTLDKWLATFTSAEGILHYLQDEPLTNSQIPPPMRQGEFVSSSKIHCIRCIGAFVADDASQPPNGLDTAHGRACFKVLMTACSSRKPDP